MALSNAQYDEIVRQYNVKQLKNQRLLEKKLEEINAKDSRFAQIDAEISHSSVACAKQLIEGDHSALDALKQHIRQLGEEKKQLLAAHGYVPDYLTPHYECPDCQDTGYINNHRCHCFTQAAIDLVYTQSNIKEILKQENFSTFSYDYYSAELKNPTTGLTSIETAKRAVTTCKDFIHNFDASFENLCFYGESGVGKTFLSNCVAKELLDSGHSVIYVTAFQLFDIFEKNTFKKDTDAMASHQNIFDCGLLIIDDLGTELANSFTTSQLFLCLNERILRKKSTIISTNLSMEDLAATYSERICSRIFNSYTLIKLFGDDIRLKKKLR